MCDLADRPPTIALETVRVLILNLVRDAVASGAWEARLV